MPDSKKHKPKPKLQVQAQPLDLYLARGLSQLNAQVDDNMTVLKAATFHSLCVTADKLWATLDEPNEHGTQDLDQERSYVLLLRYIRVLRKIETGTGDKKFVYARFGSKLENSVNRWEFLRDNLAIRYKAKNPLADISTNTSGVSVVTAATDPISMDAIVALSLEKLKVKPPMSPEFQFMAKYLCDAKSTDPKCLYQLLQDKINILIIDIRPKDVFQNSRIKCDAIMINIDGDIIRKGMSANKLGNMLSSDIRLIFQDRKKFELLIVLDENSFPMSHVHAIGEKKVYTFLDIIDNWDLDSGRYPNGGPVMLQGGFAGWIDHYPAMCINPQSRYTSGGHSTDYMDTFLAFDYPTFNYDPEKKAVLLIDRSNKPVYPTPAKKALIEDTDTDTDDIMGSDNDEAIYKSEDYIEFDRIETDDEDGMRKGLAWLAVNLRAAAKLRIDNLRNVIAFRQKYDIMSDEEQDATGDAELISCMAALDAVNDRIEQLSNRRSDYVARFPNIDVTLPPHGPVMVRADNIFNSLQTRYMRMLTEDKELITYIREVLANVQARGEAAAAATAAAAASVPSSDSINTTSNNSIPPRLSVPKIPDRMFQPAAIWIPKVYNVNDTVTGLVNYHNNCFLNATIQALRHVPTFYKYILNRDYKDEIKRHKKYPKVQLLPHVAKVVEDLWKCHQPSISAERLYKIMLEACPIFEDWRHEDGLEVFTLVFNRICEETERPMHIQAQYEFYRSDKIEHWIRMHNGQTSFLSQRFYYEIKRTRDCKMCNRKMITYDISNSMMLPLKLPNESGGMYTPVRLDLQDAVTAYMELPDRYKILCTKCKRMAIEYKKIKYYPEVAVINLKRYVNTNDTTPGAKPAIFRSDRIVSYPEHKLKIGIAQYRLNAVVCHSGTMESGHYTALCLNPVDKKWYYYDDGVVTQMTDIHDESFRRKCYVFYYSLETEFQRLNLNYAKL